MHFTIITPSFNQLEWLKRAIASVRDQVALEDNAVDDCSLLIDGRVLESTSATDIQKQSTAGITVHHHVQDAQSSDGTAEWLAEYVAQQPSTSNYQLTFSSEADEGMYDAINKGIALATQEHVDECLLSVDESRENLAVECTYDQKSQQRLITKEQPNPPNNHHSTTIHSRDSVIAWLNCDEQYLPGTLAFVGEYFEQHPEVDILFGDYLVVDQDGELLSFRKGYAPRLAYIQTSHLYNLSCTLFFRAKVFKSLGGFDTQYQAAADEDFVVRALKAGFKARHVRRYFSTFTLTGENLGGSLVAEEERKVLKQGAPFLLKLFRVPFNGARWIEKFLSGAYAQRFPLEYSIYGGDGSKRKTFVSNGAGWKWPEVAESE